MFGFPFGGIGGFVVPGVPPLVTIIFLVVIGTFLFRLVTGIIQWHKNNESPVLSSNATVVTKREAVRQCQNAAGPDTAPTMSSSTAYYATFELTDGSRMEFRVGGAEYGMLAERDTGRLTYQGTRYLGFERSRG